MKRLERSLPAPLRAACAALLLSAWCTSPVHAQAAKPAPGAPADSRTRDAGALDGHRRDDIARHRAIAAAHDAAARCLESGQKETTCQDALRKACEGIAVGRYCGMKHSH